MNRILVIGCLPGINGIASCIYNLYKHLDRTKYEWEFLVTQSAIDSGLGFDGLESLGARIHSIDYTRASFPRAARRRLKELMLSIPDLCGVHVHDSGRLNVYPLYLAHQLGLPIKVIQIHAARSEYSASAHLSTQARAARVHMINGTSFDRLACSARAGFDAYGDLPFDVFPNAVDFDRFSFVPVYRELVRAKLNIPDEAPVIGFPGHFWSVKNPLFAAEVFLAYHKLQPNSHMILLGDGPLRHAVYCMCEDAGLLPYAHFLGYCPDMELMLSAMDLMLCTSISEGFPLAVIEAQATGLPCLLSDGVPDETHVTELCESLPLEAPPSVWAQKIAEMLRPEASRRSCHSELKKAGLDIADNVNVLMEYYDKRLSDCVTRARVNVVMGAATCEDDHILV